MVITWYHCLNGTAPPYQLTAEVGSRRRLRSASTSTLVIPSHGALLWVIELSRWPKESLGTIVAKNGEFLEIV